MAGDVNIQVNPEVVRPIIEAKIQSAIIEAMQGTDKLIEQFVIMILNLKVSNDGKVSNYSSDNKYTYLYILVRDVIKKACEEAIKEEVEKRRPEFKAAIEKEIKSAAGRNKLVGAFLDTICGVAGSKAWHISVSAKE